MIQFFRQNERLKLASAGDVKKICIPIMDEVEGHLGENEKVSAAILAKVLEERAKERKRENKFCIDVGTQTHGWQFPDKIFPNPSGVSVLPENGNNISDPNVKTSTTIHENSARKNGSERKDDSAKVIQILRSISLDSNSSKLSSDSKFKDPFSETEDQNQSVSNILIASVIRSRPPSVAERRKDICSSDNSKMSQWPNSNISRTPMMKRSETCSAMQTDL